MPRFVSPNELQEAAIKMMLDGKEPVTEEDWMKCVNFWAANIDKAVGLAAMPLVAKILDCPLSREMVLEITQYQFDLRE